MGPSCSRQPGWNRYWGVCGGRGRGGLDPVTWAGPGELGTVGMAPLIVKKWRPGDLVEASLEVVPCAVPGQA